MTQKVIWQDCVYPNLELVFEQVFFDNYDVSGLEVYNAIEEYGWYSVGCILDYLQEHNYSEMPDDWEIDWTDEIAGELQSVLTKISKLERNISYRYGELIHDIEYQYHDWLTKQKGTQNA